MVLGGEPAVGRRSHSRIHPPPSTPAALEDVLRGAREVALRGRRLPHRPEDGIWNPSASMGGTGRESSEAPGPARLAVLCSDRQETLPQSGRSGLKPKAVPDLYRCAVAHMLP